MAVCAGEAEGPAEVFNLAHRPLVEPRDHKPQGLQRGIGTDSILANARRGDGRQRLAARDRPPAFDDQGFEQTHQRFRIAGDADAVMLPRRGDGFHPQAAARVISQHGLDIGAADIKAAAEHGRATSAAGARGPLRNRGRSRPPCPDARRRSCGKSPVAMKVAAETSPQFHIPPHGMSSPACGRRRFIALPFPYTRQSA